MRARPPRQRRCLPSPAMVVALVALVFSTTGLADAARHAVVAAIDGHPISSKPHAGALLTLGRNGKFPAAAIPTVSTAEDAKRFDGKTAEQIVATCPPDSVDLGTWCLESTPFPLTNADARQEQLHLGLQEVRGRRRLAALRLRTARWRRAREARVHDPRFAADRDDQPRPDAWPERRTRDELDAGHDRSGLRGGRLRGGQRRRDRRPSPGPAQPDPAARQPAAGIAAVRGCLLQRHQGRLRRLAAGRWKRRTSAVPTPRRRGRSTNRRREMGFAPRQDAHRSRARPWRLADPPLPARRR